MASTATTTLRIEKPAAGEKTGLWDAIANLNAEILEAAIHGTTSVSTTGGTTTLTDVDFTNDQAKKGVIYVSGALVSNAIVVIPNTSRRHTVINATTGSFTVSVKTSSGSAVTVPQGCAAHLYCNGSNVITYIAPITVTATGAPNSSTGAVASSVSVTPTGNLSSSNAQAALAELQGDIDDINTALAQKQGLDTDLTAIAALSNAKGNIIAGDGSAWQALTVGSNGLNLRAKSSASVGFEWAAGAPSGSIQPWQQTAAPTGWTKQTTHNDKALRVVSGTASSGGSTAFTSVFTARTISQANLPNINLTSNTDGAHTHDYIGPSNTTVGTDGGGAQAYTLTRTTAAGGTHSHTIPLGGSGTAMDFAVQYVDLILAAAD